MMLFCAVSCYVLGQPASLTLRETERLDAIAGQDVPDGAPGIVAGIVRNGKVIYQKTAGYADLSDSTLIGPGTRFNIASNGKQFTALAVLLLVEEGKLRLTDDIRRFFPRLFPTVEQSITIEHLLNHSSGIRDVYDLWSLQGLTWWEHSFRNADAVELLRKQQDLNFSPGAQHLYSNSNYILLAEIIARASGESFVSYTNRLFGRLNMPNTSFVDDHEKVAGPIARPYFNFDTWVTYDWIWNVCGDGNIFSTLEDQLEWEKTVQKPSRAGIPARLVRQSQQLTGNTSIASYGYGLEFGDYKGLPYRFHGGATGAWKSMFMRFPEQNLSVVTLINTGKADPAMQTRQMADVLLGLDTEEVPFSTLPEAVGDFVDGEEILGVYLLGQNTSFQFVQSDGELYLKRFGRNDIRLIREEKNIFHQWNDPAFKLAFTRNAGGELQVTAYYPTHPPYTLTRSDDDWNGFDFHSLDGRFYNEETGVEVALEYLADRQYRIRIAGRETKGLLVSPAKLLVDSYLFELDAGEDRLDRFWLSGDRIRKVFFARVE